MTSLSLTHGQPHAIPILPEYLPLFIIPIPDAVIVADSVQQRQAYWIPNAHNPQIFHKLTPDSEPIYERTLVLERFARHLRDSRHRAAILLRNQPYRMAIINDPTSTLKDKIFRLMQFNFVLGLPAPVPLLDQHGHVHKIIYIVQDDITQTVVDLTVVDTDPDFLAISACYTHTSQIPAPAETSEEETTDEETTDEEDSEDDHESYNLCRPE